MEGTHLRYCMSVALCKLVRIADYLHHCMACKCCTIYSPLSRWQHLLDYWLVGKIDSGCGPFLAIYRLLGEVFNDCSTGFSVCWAWIEVSVLGIQRSIGIHHLQGTAGTLIDLGFRLFWMYLNVNRRPKL